MPYGSDEIALFDRFGCCYRHARSEVMVEIERRVFGCDYGSTSWTTREDAERIARMLNLSSHIRILDVGSGSGWPALYWARLTGCAVVLTDVPLDGLRVAYDRAEQDQLTSRCWFVAADAAALPFPGGAFDAITHSDVLCCLPLKAAVLATCRRLIRANGVMAFTVISIAPGLSEADRLRAIESGPPFIDSAVDYLSMLRDANWQVADRLDVTPQYGAAVRRLLREEESRREDLVELLGPEEYRQRLVQRRRTAIAVEAGLIQRELFRAVPQVEAIPA